MEQDDVHDSDSELSEPQDMEEPDNEQDENEDEEVEQEDEDMQDLQFDEELSWRPAKPISVGTLIPRLEILSKELAEFDQGAVNIDSVKDVAEKLAHRNLLQHKDRGVRAYTACCLVDILRIFVPHAPFTSDQLKVWSMIFSATS